MSLEQRKQQNRERMPQTATWMDALSDFQPRVIWAEENGHSVGRRE